MTKQKEKSFQSQQFEVLGILIVMLSLLMFLGILSFHETDYPNSGSAANVKNWLGLAGAYLSYYLFNFTIGYASYVFPLIIFLLGWNLFLHREFKQVLRICAYLLAFGIYLSTAFAIPEAVSEGGSAFGTRLSGLFGFFIAEHLTRYLGTPGSMVFLVFMFIIFLVTATSWSVRQSVLSFQAEIISLFLRINEGLKRFRQQAKKPRPGKKPVFQPDPPKPAQPQIQTGLFGQGASADEPVQRPAPIIHHTPKPPASSEIKSTVPSGTPPAIIPAQPGGVYMLPTIDLLHDAPDHLVEVDRKALEEKARFLEEKLLEFDVRGEVTGIEPGPVITRFEVTPAPGVKISRFTGVQEDLSLVMRATRVRVVAPIPGKGAVGIEIPNDNPAMVTLKNVLQSEVYRKPASKLIMALGKTIEGSPYVTDLGELPHLLVAGATGSGKSVCLNTIIASILYRAKPDEVKFVLIDPKKLELSLYKKLKNYHLTTSESLNEDVVTTVDNAVAILKSVEKEMDKRYKLLARIGVRGIGDFNQLVAKQKVQPNPDAEPLSPLPYIVVVVDELADLMITGAREVEEPITRLAQMARAVGIHLILATQRPSVDVITGVIKANFPARIAFQVTAKIDSRTIIDRNGAEKLLGRGDMLFMHPREPEPIRVHGAYISTEEVQRIMKHISQQPKTGEWKLPGFVEKSASGNGFGTGERDELFWEAAKLVVRHQQGSASLLQRRLRVGYARAGRLIDELEEAGIVGPFDGSKAREVILDEEALEELKSIEDSHDL